MFCFLRAFLFFFFFFLTMFRFQLSAATQRRGVAASQLTSQRALAYYPSAWSAFTSASLSRYFHCTLKETLQRERKGGSAVAPSPSPSASAVESAMRAAGADARAVPPESENALSPMSVNTTGKGKLPTMLRYSLELSLPHLPGRTPFTRAPEISESEGDIVELLRTSLPQKPTVESASRNEFFHPRWFAFVQLCDAIATTADAYSSAQAAPSAFVGVTIPCKEPYFRAVDSAPAVPVSTLSTIQAAILLFHQHWRVPVTLALNTTVANRAAVPSHAKNEQDSAKGNRKSSDAAAMDGAVGASLSGIHAVVRDFVQHLDGRQLLLVRGDSPSTQRGLAAPRKSVAASVSSSNLSELHTSADLACCVRSLLRSPEFSSFSTAAEGNAGVRIAVAGYPQGHPLDRTWGALPVAVTTAAATATGDTNWSSNDRNEGHSSKAREKQDAFFHRFERDFSAADSLYDRVVVSHVKPAEAPPLPALHHLFQTIGRLCAVRQLWLTPSTYSDDIRAACTQQLIEDKVLRGGARVIVTQLLTSVEEYKLFTHDVQQALQMTASRSSLSPSPPSVEVVPGILLPHPTEPSVLLRALYYAKVIPSTRLQRALETYRADLKSVWRSIVSHSSSTTTNEKAVNDRQNSGCRGNTMNDVSYQQDVTDGYVSTWPGLVELSTPRETAAAEAFVHDAHRRAAARFAVAWMAETVDVLSGLRQFSGEQTPVHFFTMFNDRADVRLAQLLEAYAAKRQKTSVRL